MRFEVPQFIDVEDKIFGPLTFKQFIYLAGGAGLGYVSFKLLPIPLSYIFLIIFVGLGLMLAFYKLNNRTFLEIAQAFIAYQIKGKVYIWKRAPAVVVHEPVVPVIEKIPEPQKIINDRTIGDLANNLDIMDTNS